MENMPKLLIVEDNTELRDLISKFLKKDGYRISTAGNGREMLSELDKE